MMVVDTVHTMHMSKPLESNTKSKHKKTQIWGDYNVCVSVQQF